MRTVWAISCERFSAIAAGVLSGATPQTDRRSRSPAVCRWTVRSALSAVGLTASGTLRHADDDRFQITSTVDPFWASARGVGVPPIDLAIHCTKSLRDGPHAREGRQRWRAKLLTDGLR